MLTLDSDDCILVAGAGGFIGGHMVRTLSNAGYRRLRAVDLQPLEGWHQHSPDADNRVLDLRDPQAAQDAVEGARYVFNFASDMGGMGFIERNKAACMLSVLINTHLLQAAKDAGVRRFFFASSACVYAADKQDSPEVSPLREEDAYPAMPEDGYGWEKLFSERMCRHFTEDFGLETRVARYHNVYGPHGTWRGGREKAPAALCRKVAEAVLDARTHLDVWGDGRQTRSFTFIDDAIHGTRLLMENDVAEPLNIGSEELVTIDGLARIVEGVAGVSLEHRYDTSAPMGVRGRNSDNTRIRQLLGWAPSTPLEKGLRDTYEWIAHEVRRTRSEPVSG
jgi:nucleoside-diphosphate-sugar epimerase